MSQLLSHTVGEPLLVRGVIAIICGDVKRKGGDDGDVTVIGRKDLDSWLTRQPTDRLTPVQIEGNSSKLAGPPAGCLKRASSPECASS